MEPKRETTSQEPGPFGKTDLDTHWLEYFEYFNRGMFFEGHEVLEAIWLPARDGPDGDFYKGLIQLAGAFVHVQKRRRGPAAALFRLASANLGKYPPLHHDLNINSVLRLIRGWLGRVQEPAFPGAADGWGSASNWELPRFVFRDGCFGCE